MKSRRTTNWLIAAFLTFQLLYPIRGLVRAKFDTWGEFTWNMFSQTYECLGRYRLIDQAGAETDLNLRQYFVIPAKVGRSMNREDLPVLHRFLCRQTALEGRPGQIHARVSCTWNKAETRSLVQENVDICTAPNNAVL